MASPLEDLSWGERFAIIEDLNPTDEQIMATIGCDADELATAREMLEEGAFSVDSSIDTTAYVGVFVDPTESEPEVAAVTEEPVEQKTVQPQTASPPERAPKKRGRKGDKIVKAFTAVTTTPVPVEAFAEEYGVSVNVLRQAKRFDATGIEGRVRVKKVDGTLSIFREVEAEASTE